MKKILLLMALMMSSAFAFAEQVVGSYTMGGSPREIEAFIDKKGVLKVFIEIEGEYRHDKVMIKIDGESDLNRFVSQLKYCKGKFIEWKKVAQENNVTDYRKKLDVIFPKVEIWWLGNEWYSSYKRGFIEPLFLVGSDGDAVLVAGGKAKDWDNEYIDQKWYLIFMSESEIDSLIEALNPTKIKEALNQTSNNDALFQ